MKLLARIMYVFMNIWGAQLVACLILFHHLHISKACAQDKIQWGLMIFLVLPFYVSNWSKDITHLLSSNISQPRDLKGQDPEGNQ
jgi:hypothetical protein